MDWYTLEDRNEDADDGEAYDIVVTPEEDAAKLDDGENAVLEQYAAEACLSDICLPMTCGILYVVVLGEG